MEGNVLFNDALNTFYLWLYGIRHIIKDSERWNPLLPHVLFLISSEGSFICTIIQMAHTTAFVTPVVEHWLKREIAPWVHNEGSIWRSITPWVNALTMELHLAPTLNTPNNTYKHTTYTTRIHKHTTCTQTWTSCTTHTYCVYIHIYMFSTAVSLKHFFQLSSVSHNSSFLYE